jgi:hypothetical protein
MTSRLRKNLYSELLPYLLIKFSVDIALLKEVRCIIIVVLLLLAFLPYCSC